MGIIRNADIESLVIYLARLFFVYLHKLKFYIMSKGEQVIGRFNASSQEAVDVIKQKAIELVDLIQEHGKDERRKAIAITDIEKGTMMAVKSLF